MLEHCPYGVLLLLGKHYFHVCKFKQSLFSINLAVKKCKDQRKVNQGNLSECLLWTIFVRMIYLVNKIRVLKNYRLGKKDKKKGQK